MKKKMKEPSQEKGQASGVKKKRAVKPSTLKKPTR
jgi:hypothetical protein